MQLQGNIFCSMGNKNEPPDKDYAYPYCSDFSKYDIVLKIGQGTFGEVFKAKDVSELSLSVTKITAAQIKVALSYHRLSGLCFLAVIFEATALYRALRMLLFMISLCFANSVETKF